MGSIREALEEIGSQLDVLDRTVIQGAHAVDRATLESLKRLRQRLNEATKRSENVADVLDEAVLESAGELRDEVRRIYGELMQGGSSTEATRHNH